MAPSPRKATRGIVRRIEGQSAVDQPVEITRPIVEIVKMPQQRIHVQLDGLVAVHAVRAVWTALGAVPGVLSADVNMQGAVLEVEGELDRAALDVALDAAGVSIRSLRVEGRVLPVL